MTFVFPLGVQIKIVELQWKHTYFVDGVVQTLRSLNEFEGREGTKVSHDTIHVLGFYSFRQVHLERYFPTYKGGVDINEAAKHILWHFMQANRALLNMYPQ